MPGGNPPLDVPAREAWRRGPAGLTAGAIRAVEIVTSEIWPP